MVIFFIGFFVCSAQSAAKKFWPLPMPKISEGGLVPLGGSEPLQWRREQMERRQEQAWLAGLKDPFGDVLSSSKWGFGGSRPFKLSRPIWAPGNPGVDETSEQWPQWMEKRKKYAERVEHALEQPEQLASVEILESLNGGQSAEFPFPEGCRGGNLSSSVIVIKRWKRRVESRNEIEGGDRDPVYLGRPPVEEVDSAE